MSMFATATPIVSNVAHAVRPPVAPCESGRRYGKAADGSST